MNKTKIRVLETSIKKIENRLSKISYYKTLCIVDILIEEQELVKEMQNLIKQDFPIIIPSDIRERIEIVKKRRKDWEFANKNLILLCDEEVELLMEKENLSHELYFEKRKYN